MIDRNDPRLTAFALGELDEAELQEIDAAVKASPELQREVAAIQQSVNLLQASLGAEACHNLTAVQRASIEAASESAVPGLTRTRSTAPVPADAMVSSSNPTARRMSLRRTISLATVVCALLLVGGMAIINWDPNRFVLRSIAQHDELDSATPQSTASDPALRSTPLPTIAGDDLHDAYGTPNVADGFARFREDGSAVESRRSASASAVEPDRQIDVAATAGEPAADRNEIRRQVLGEVEEERLGLETAVDPPGKDGDSWFGRPLRSKALVGDSTETEGGETASPPSEMLADTLPPSDPLKVDLSEPALQEWRESLKEAAPLPVGAQFTDPPTNRSVFGSGLTRDSVTEPAKRAEDKTIEEIRLQSLPRLMKERAVKESVVDDLVDNETEIPRDPADVADEKDTKENELAKAVKKATWTRSRATPNASQLKIGDHDGLPLEGMQVNVLVDGFRARVLLDLYFFNNRKNRLEGEFKLRLPNEASLYYFAFGQSAYEYRPMVDQLASKGFLSRDLLRAASLNPGGIMKARETSWTDVKEARVVPREKAAHAYSETVRKRVDPALVEWSGAGVFNARVFPLMPNKLHRVVVGYDVNLQQQGDDLVYALDLPVDQGECVVDLNVSAMPGVTAEVTPSARPFMSGGRAYYHLKDPANQAINVRFKNLGSMLLTGSDEQAGEFFVSRLTPELPDDETGASSPRAMFLVDTSLSSRPEKFNVWLDMLKAVLTENRDSIDEFAVLFFNIESSWWQPGFRENNEANVEQLLADCHRLSLEGATDLRQALQEAVNPAWARTSAAENAPRPDLFLLSDGAVTWGEMNVHGLSQTLQRADAGPLFAYQTGLTGTAVGTLEHLTRETGGAVFSVTNADEIPRVARAHRQRPWQLVEVDLPGGHDVLVAGRPKFIYPGQSLLVVGRGTPDAEAAVRVRRGDQQQLLEVTIHQTVASTLTPRVYGQVAVGQLEDLGSHVEDVAVAYARHFRVTGQTCSLLMLESEADYQRFNIKPEEDALLVRTSPSADLITAKLDELAEQLGDAKSTMLNWLKKLEQSPGVQFEMPTALRLVLDRLPPEAFDVDSARLACSQRTNDDTPQEFLRRLDSGQLDYASVTSRAANRFDQLGPADALRTLSSLIENNPGDPVLTRDVAFSALEWGLGGQAFYLLRRVAEMRPAEPQAYQAISKCLSEAGNADLAMIYYEIAMNAKWHNRYLDVKQIVGVEYVDLLRKIERGEVSSHAREYAAARLETMRGRVPVDKADLVVTMMWNTDRTDVDLHVIEPTGEECYYEHPRTKIGGRMTRDVTEGFGPEMYTLAKAKAGEYRLLANYYGSDANRTSVRSKVYVTVYRNYGDPKRQWIESKTITLADQKEKRELMTVKVKP